MRILHIADTLPYPLNSGVNQRVFHVLKRVAAQHEVWFLAFLEGGRDEADFMPVYEVCHRVITVPFQMGAALSQPIEILRYLLRGIPIDLRLYQSPQMVAQIQQLTTTTEFDVVQIEHPIMMPYLEALPEALQKRAVLVAHDVDFKKYRRIAAIEPRVARKLRVLLHSKMMERWEAKYAGRFPRYVTVSDVDGRVLLAKNPAIRLEVVPNGTDAKATHILPESEDEANLVYVGTMAYPPNVDAVQWFTGGILPLVRQVRDDVHFWIVGRKPVAAVKALASDAIHVTGAVDSVEPYYADSTICVVPLRAGGGTRLKILEAMALGRPVISTSIGCEGLEVTDGENIIIADDEQTFASKILELLADKERRRKIAAGGRKLVEEKYDWDNIAAKMMTIYETLRAEGRQSYG